MESSDLVDGLALAAVALDGAHIAPGLALAPHLVEALRARLAALSDAPDRRSAMASLAERARPRQPAALPRNPRAAALLAPLAPRQERERVGPLPPPRRGFRAPPGLASQLARVLTAPDRQARARDERARVEARPWPA
jgi:hypothetical protein